MKNFGIILTPDSRSKAYLQKILSKGIKPKDIIFMNNHKKEIKFGYEEIQKGKDYGFDISEPVSKTLKENNLNYKEFNFVDINNKSIIVHIQNTSIMYYVFTGGGILKKEILNCGKKFIHLHSGIVPQYRGSTCVYYSIIEHDTCGVTAFIMNVGLDTGDVIFQKEYTKPNHIYLDEVYDSHIRSDTLLEVLNNDEIIPKEQNKEGNVFFIIHPVLKHIAIASCYQKKNYTFPDEFIDKYNDSFLDN